MTNSCCHGNVATGCEHCNFRSLSAPNLYDSSIFVVVQFAASVNFPDFMFDVDVDGEERSLTLVLFAFFLFRQFVF